jgi:hypothetical protein
MFIRKKLLAGSVNENLFLPKNNPQWLSTYKLNGFSRKNSALYSRIKRNFWGEDLFDFGDVVA